MPTFDKGARYPGGQTRIAIPTLSGGVGRQAPTKRSVNEAENLDNALVTLERSVEKRPPTNVIKRYNDSAFSTLDPLVLTSSLNLADTTANSDYKFFWFQISEEQRYLIALNYQGTSTDYMQIFRVTTDGFYECTIKAGDLIANYNYFVEGNATLSARNVLSSITIGPQLLINNNQVYAGYTSKLRTFESGDTLDGVATSPGDTAWCKIGLDGEFIIDGSDYTEDIKGRKLVYFTTTPVDPEGQATIYVDGKFYIRNDQVFMEVPSGTDLEDWLYRKQDVSGTLNFTEAVANGGPHSNPDEDLFSIDTESLPDAFEPFGVTRLDVFDDFTDTGAAAGHYVKFTFDNQEGRDKAAQFTKFYIGGNPLLLSDAISTDNGPSPTEWYLTWSHSQSVTATVADTRLTTVTLAVYDAFNAGGGGSSGALPFNISYRFYGTYKDVASIPESLQYVVEDYAGENFTLLDDTVLIFSCLNDGTATTNIPATAIEAGLEAAHFTLRSDDDGGALGQYIPVEDWRYPDSNRRYLGNKLSDFSQFKFPPRSDEDVLDNDGTDVASYPNIDAEVDPWPDPYEIFNLPPVNMENLVGETLESLYDDLATGGTGKIYYVENSYAGEVPGYYIVKNVENSPYVRLIRTPYEYSVLDADRFPKILKINQFNSGIEEFTIQNMALEERRSGSLNTNPGPEAFKDGTQRRIKSMAFFRDRLFLSADDTVFSSRTGDFSDFWVQNPGIIADTDPIDIRLSTNKYAEVESMTPFSSSMFINTGSDIQFTLQGSENNITPFTAEISPTAFYSTSPLVDPVLLGSQIYFFAPKRAYIFFNDATVSINQAIEVSLTCPNYLPTNFGDVTVIPGYDTLCMIDDDNKKFVYMYTNRYRGADVVQNAFFRYIYDTDIVSINSYDNDIYLVSRYAIGDAYEYHLEYQKFYEEDSSIPRIDHQTSLSETDTAQYGSITYDGGADRTTIVVNHYSNPSPDFLIIANESQSEERAGETIRVTSELEDDVVVSVGTVDGTLTIVLEGDFTTSTSYRKFIFGSSYNMSVELSPQYVRDQNQNVVEGVFSIRTLHLQHYNTGSYHIEKEIRGRRSRVLTFTPTELEATNFADPGDIPMPLYEKSGETFSKIMGFAAETSIFIESDYPNPVNISQIEIKGRFTNKTSGFVR